MKLIRIFGLIIGGLLIAAAIFAASIALVVQVRFAAPGPLAEEKVVAVPDGVGMKTIARIFWREGVISDPRLFAFATRLTRADRAVRAGEYFIPRHTSMAELLDILRSGRVVLHKLTLPEGLTSMEIVQILEATPGLSGHIETPPQEGTLLPETYYFVRGDDRNEILRRMQRSMTSFLETQWPFRAENLPLANPHEAVILASIVEKETGVNDERAHVAGVYLNRLRQGMLLQADPTVSYGLGEGMPLNRSLRLSDLRHSTPFNTYLFKGLPPQAIANPGVAAIKAVLDPMPTDDLFFVADGTGGHAFSKSLKEHNRNVAKLRMLQQEKAKQTAP